MKKIFSVCISVAVFLGLITTSLALEADMINPAQSSPQNIVVASQEFAIANGVLTKYNGSGGSVTIPYGITKIGDGAFEFCDHLTSVSIPDTVTEIGARAFKGTKLVSVTIPNSVKKIGQEAFWSCSHLATVTIGSGVTEMGGIVFEMCDKLTNVTILNGTTAIGTNAFRNCFGLTSITLPASITQIGEGAFEVRDGAIYVGTLPRLTIHGVSSSYVESYARQKGIRFQADASFPNLPSTTTPPANIPSTGFIDVPESAFCATPVRWAISMGITNGSSTYTFSPDQTCTKAQILTFIWRASGEPEPTIRNPFRDISASDYYYKAAIWAYERGMVAGSSFLGSTVCTRGLAVTYLWNMKGSPATPVTGQFIDVSSGQSCAQAVAWAVENGITNGTGTKTFSPSSACTRGQIMTFLYRCLVEPMAVVSKPATSPTTDGSGWNDAYRNFVLNEGFLTTDYPYQFEAMSAWGDEAEYQVSLYDFDRDGTPELAISNGYTGKITGQCYVYAYEGGDIKYIGTARLSFACIPSSKYSGAFCDWGFEYDLHGLTYYWKNGSTLVRESVYTYSLANVQDLHMETSDAALFNESQKSMTAVPVQSISNIRQMGWDNFVARALG